MKRIVVAGGSGLIGQAFINRALAGGYEVVLLTRREQALTPAQYDVVWDGRTVGEWQHWLEGAFAVVNLAGENIGAGPWTVERKRRILSSRVDAGRALVQALEKTHNKPQVFLQASAIGYYGPSTGSSLMGASGGHTENADIPVVTESNPAGNDYLSQICVDWEASTGTVEALGLRRVTLRTGIVLAAEAGALPRMLPLFKLFAGGPLGNGKQYWSWISLADEVAAMWFLLNHEETWGAYNLTAPNPVTMADFGRALAAVLHRPYWLPAPAFALRLVLGEMSALVLDSQRIIPQRLAESGFAFEFPELRGALEALAL